MEGFALDFGEKKSGFRAKSTKNERSKGDSQQRKVGIGFDFRDSAPRGLASDLFSMYAQGELGTAITHEHGTFVLV